MRISILMAGVLATGLMVAVPAGEAAEWSYEGAEGPENWGDLSGDYAVCKAGTQQSPIDLTAAVDAELADVELSWNAIDWTVLNNGHTIQVQGENAGAAVIEGETFQLVQFHFHTPSEHAIDGERYPMEVHFVHAHEDGRLAVIGVMMDSGGENALFSGIMDAAPEEEGQASLGAGDATALIPGEYGLLRYQGSLTTPPCFEVVLWTVLDEVLEVDEDDIDAFAELFPMNARPLQPLNRRYVLED